MRKLKKMVSVALVCVLGSYVASAESSEKAWKKLVGKRMGKRIEFAYVENNSSLPNVLIYGDSISIGYTQTVRKQLAGKANVYRIYCNGGDSGSFIRKMTKMHKAMQSSTLDNPWNFKWDVIHFNVGLHDLKYVTGGKLDKESGKQVSSTKKYKKNLKSIVAYLQTKAPDAGLVFATTTPVPEGADGRFAGDAVKYNKAALDVMTSYPEIAINDMFTFTKPNQTTWWVNPGNVHYATDGKQKQGTRVTNYILEALAKKK